MVNSIATCWFLARNGEQANDGHIGKYAVAIGQAKKIYDEVAALDNAIGKGFQSTADILNGYAASNKIVGGAGKLLKFASQNVNPLIITSAVIDTAMADDKITTGVTSAAGVTAMFGAEKLMKKFLTKESEVKLAQRITDFVKKIHPERAGKIGRIGAYVAYGLAFASASIVGYSGGKKFGKLLIGDKSDK